MTPIASSRDVEKLSAYLDGQLKTSEKARLESRLKSEPELASALNDLRQARRILRQLPQRRAPRNFTLTPTMVGQKPPMPGTYPVFRFASVLAAVLLFFTFATNFMSPRLAPAVATVPFEVSRAGADEPAAELAMEAAPQDLAEPAQAPEPAADLAEPAEPTHAPEPAAALAEPAEPAATEEIIEPKIEGEAMAEAPASVGDSADQDMPAPTPTPGAVYSDDSTRNQGFAPTVSATEKSGVQEYFSDELYVEEESPVEAVPAQPALPFSTPVQILLAGIALTSGVIALAIRYAVIRKWRAIGK